jgi:glycosyltransferase involved in cell wall biosynthesis
MPQSEFTITMLMPCLNEALTIESCIVQAQKSLLVSGLVGEVLVADNGSTDNSQEIAKRCGARVIEVPEKGYGAALRAGISASNSDFVIMGDADGSYAWDELEEMIAALIGGADLVMGNRFRGGIEDGAMPFLNRHLGNPVLSFIGRILYQIDIRDFHCGLRGFRRNSVSLLGLESSGMEFASEMVVKAGLSGLKICEVPTVLRKDGRDRPPHLRPMRDGWRHLRFLLTYSPRGVFRLPGALLLVLGVLGVGLILLDFNQFGKVVLGPQSALFFAAMVIIGYNALIFSVVSEQHLANAGIAQGSRFNRLMAQKESLELELLFGLVLTIAGLGGCVISISRWSKLNFGMLDVMPALKISIPSIIFVIIGVQTMFMAFLIQVGKNTHR